MSNGCAGNLVASTFTNQPLEVTVDQFADSYVQTKRDQMCNYAI